MNYNIILPTLAYALLQILPLSLSSAAASQEIDPDYHSRCDPPFPTGKKINEIDAEFYYVSDVEDCDDRPLPYLVSRVRNVGDDGLIVTWKTNGDWLIYRPADRRLPAGKTEDGSHSICDYTRRPDTRPTISYTQRPVTKRAPAYLEKTPCDETSAALRSHLRTAYRDDEGIVQNVSVEFRSAVLPDALHYSIDKTNSAVDVAIGGASAAIETLGKEQQAKIQQIIADWAAEYGASAEFATLEEWRPDSPAMDAIPTDLKKEGLMIFDAPTSTDKHYMEWRIPKSAFGGFARTTAPLLLLAPSGDMITTRPAAFYFPQAEQEPR